ncbi:MAG: peptidoglycan-binding domain-containing protein [Cyclobacteriaceae bacterium]
MKKLLIIVIVITLPLIAFFQYANYHRFHPPVNYDYPISDQIDLMYYDQDMIKEYYRNSIEMGQLARTLWFNDGIDVRFPDIEDSLSLNYSTYYTHLKARNQFIESRLVASKMGREKGWSIAEIKLMEQGIDPSEMSLREESIQYAGLALGSVGEKVVVIQKFLNDKGYSIPVDAVFGLATRDSLKSFQNDKGLTGTGIVDYQTYINLKK